jgi:hypothetical protein
MVYCQKSTSYNAFKGLIPQLAVNYRYMFAITLIDYYYHYVFQLANYH